MISSRTHGVIDYAFAAAAFATPRLLGWEGRTRRLMDGAAALSTLYAHLTDYEFGAYPLLSMPQHLAIDAAEGAAFLGAAWMLDDEPQGVRLALAGYGLLALGAALLTDRQAGGHPGDRWGGGGRQSGRRALQDGRSHGRGGRRGGRFPRDPGAAGSQRARRGSWVMPDDSPASRSLSNGDWSEGRRRITEAEWRQAQAARDLRQSGMGQSIRRTELRHLPRDDARRGYQGGQGI